MTERHLDGLIDDANGALQLLSSLADSFRTVEEQTTSFQSQCNDLLSEQRRLEKLADEVGTDLYYYAYADSVTRRLNAIGASRLVDDEGFGEILSNLDACIAFMTKHVSGTRTLGRMPRTGHKAKLTLPSRHTVMQKRILRGTSLC